MSNYKRLSQMLRLSVTLGFSIHVLGAGRKSSSCWGLGGPGGPKNHPKRWGNSPSVFWFGCLGRRGRPNPKNRRVSVLPPPEKNLENRVDCVGDTHGLSGSHDPGGFSRLDRCPGRSFAAGKHSSDLDADLGDRL